MASFGIPAWAAWTANIFQQYSPFSWVAAGFCGLFIVTLSFALFVWARNKLQIVGLRTRILDTSQINPLDKTFENKRINIRDLAPPIGGLIENKVFVDCDILGPASVIFLGCTLNGNSVVQVDGLIVRDAKPPTNGFGFKNCTFSGCRFYAVTFMILEEQFHVFAPNVWPGINWITDTPDPTLFDDLTPIPDAESDTQPLQDTE